MTVDTSTSLAVQCKQVIAHVKATKRSERQRIDEPQLIRLWDGEYLLQHVPRVFDEDSFEFVDNDTGPGMLKLPFSMPAARWIKDMKGRIDRGEKRTVNITVDKNGARWDGKLADCTVEETEDGDQILTATFQSSFEELKHYTVRSNPILPAAFQFPRVWILPGPARWAILTTLWFQLLRQFSMVWNIPNDPLDASEWNPTDMHNWSVVIKPLSFVQDMAAGTIWGMPISRWQNFYNVVKPILDDGELSFRLRRYLNGDPRRGRVRIFVTARWWSTLSTTPESTSAPRTVARSPTDWFARLPSSPRICWIRCLSLPRIRRCRQAI